MTEAGPIRPDELTLARRQWLLGEGSRMSGDD